MSTCLWHTEGGGLEHKKAWKRLASLQAMRPAIARRDATPLPELTRDKLLEMERGTFVLTTTLSAVPMDTGRGASGRPGRWGRQRSPRRPRSDGLTRRPARWLLAGRWRVPPECRRTPSR